MWPPSTWLAALARKRRDSRLRACGEQLGACAPRYAHTEHSRLPLSSRRCYVAAAVATSTGARRLSSDLRLRRNEFGAAALAAVCKPPKSQNRDDDDRAAGDERRRSCFEPKVRALPVGLPSSRGWPLVNLRMVRDRPCAISFICMGGGQLGEGLFASWPLASPVDPSAPGQVFGGNCTWLVSNHAD